MTGNVIPAQPGTHAVFHLPGGQAVLRTVLAWELRTGFEPSATPITLVGKDSLPGSGELGLAAPRAVVFEEGRVESLDGSRAWASVEEYCRAKGLTLVRQ
ncbi:hypothetical protein [Mesorhizobium australicum]|uniref:Uncharacterized protein n=1 Tax=Mesorhizobium australicum TaxID=536018 RepID=A0A1X7P0T6_9HYPH|nr:hypothetical protein [Mesorhizobium australicum]SMH43475.1 hypothetical protein SAMN02982922_2912 [Mesorhizobium australicum]